jgi:transcriptional regulator GlxA family with amidase domain
LCRETEENNVWTELRKPVAGILLFDDVEVLDFAGPYEVLVAARRANDESYFEVVTVAERREVTCWGGLQVTAGHTFDTCPKLDFLIVPGGPGAREKRPDVQAAPLAFLIARQSELGALASVCTGSFLLARAGILDGRRATTHTRRIDLFRSEFPQIDVVQEKVVDLGNILTAGGVSSGIDLALYLIEREFGTEARVAEAIRLDGPWK